MPRRIWIGLVLLLALAYADAARAETLYPVWISPRLGITSTAEIPDLLERPFDEALEMVDTEGARTRPTRSAKNCQELFAHYAEGFGFWFPWQQPPGYFRLARCQLLVELTGLQPSGDNWFATYDIGAAPLATLPAFIMGAPGDDWLCRQEMAMRLGIALGEFSPAMRVIDRGERNVTIADARYGRLGSGEYSYANLIALAAFGADQKGGNQVAIAIVKPGQDDRYFEGRGPERLVRLARRPHNLRGFPLVAAVPGDIFRYAKGYRCQQTYDEPSALKNQRLRP